MGGVVITNSQKKVTDWIDSNGNILDIQPGPTGLINNGVKGKVDEPDYRPTKEEIEHLINLPKEPVKIPANLTVENAPALATPPPVAAPTQPSAVAGPLVGIPVASSAPAPVSSIDTLEGIQTEIDATEVRLLELKQKKKAKVAEMKALLKRVGGK